MQKTRQTKNQVSLVDWVRTGLQRVSVLHFVFTIGYCLQIISHDASKVITPEVVLWRWYAAGGLTAIVAIVWYLVHNKNNDLAALKRLLFLLVSAGLAFASFNVYTQRGMASRAVLLFALPIIVSALLLNRAAIFATATLAATTYIVTALAYFTYNFNEGYKAELYGEILFYSFSFFVIAGLLSILVRFGGSSKDA